MSRVPGATDHTGPGFFGDIPPRYNGTKEAPMFELTADQRQALRQAQGNQLRVTDPETGQEYLVLRADVYDRLKALLYDDGDWTPDEQLRLLAESGKQAGWDDPAMDVYDNYDDSRRKQCP
jgi:hypothetical protein